MCYLNGEGKLVGGGREGLGVVGRELSFVIGSVFRVVLYLEVW